MATKRHSMKDNGQLGEDSQHGAKRKRGPYKKYLYDRDARIPRRTMHRLASRLKIRSPQVTQRDICDNTDIRDNTAVINDNAGGRNDADV